MVVVTSMGGSVVASVEVEVEVAGDSVVVSGVVGVGVAVASVVEVVVEEACDRSDRHHPAIHQMVGGPHDARTS